MNLDPSVLHAPVLDHRGLDLAAARRVSYILEQSFRYEYDAPVESLRQRLVIVPPVRHGNQYLRAHHLQVTGAKARRRVRRDAAGNVVAWLRADHVPEAHRVPAGRGSRTGPRRRPRRAPGRRPAQPAPAPADPAHGPRRAAARAGGGHRRGDPPAGAGPADPAGPEDLAERICAAVSSAITYEYGITSVTTTAAEALACGRGVCQDSAHVMLALCHILDSRPGTSPATCSARAAPMPGSRSSCPATAGPRGHRLRSVQRPPHRQRLRHRRHRPRLRRRRPRLRLLRRRLRRAASPPPAVSPSCPPPDRLSR